MPACAGMTFKKIPELHACVLYLAMILKNSFTLKCNSDDLFGVVRPVR